MESEFLRVIKQLQEEIVRNRKEIKSAIEASETRLLLKIEELKQKVSSLEIENKILKNKTEILDRNSRKNNIIIFGLKDSEGNTANKISKKIGELLGVDVKETDINNFYRLDKSAKPPIKVEFLSYLKKTEILKKCKKLKDTGIAISNDLTIEQRSEQKILRSFLKRTRQDPTDQSFIKGNKLYINNRAYTVEDLQEIEYSEKRNVNSAPATPNIRTSEKEFEFETETGDIFGPKSPVDSGKQNSNQEINPSTPRSGEIKKCSKASGLMNEKPRRLRSNK